MALPLEQYSFFSKIRISAGARGLCHACGKSGRVWVIDSLQKMENLGGGGGVLSEIPLCSGGMDIFWNYQGSKLTFLLRSQLATNRKNLVARSKSLVANLFNIQLSRKHDFKCYFTYKESHNKTAKKEQHEKDVLSSYGCFRLLCFWFRDGVLFGYLK